MCFEQADKCLADAVGKKHMRQFFRMRVREARTVFAEAADFFKRAGDAVWISRELHGRSVGKKFALAADGGLNQASEKNADVADDQQRESENRKRILSATATTAARGLQKNPSDDGEAQNSENRSHEPQI